MRKVASSDAKVSQFINRTSPAPCGRGNGIEIGMKYIAYIRVSSEKQGRSGLGLEAQREIIKYNVPASDLLAWYEEVKSGKDVDALPQLQLAKEHARREDAVLVIAKTDRLRNTRQALELVEEMSSERVFFCNVGRNADKFTLTLFFAFAEKERLEISIRTRAALAQLKAKGIKLGRWTHKNYCENRQKELQLKRAKAGAAARKMQSLNSKDNILSYRFASALRAQKKTYSAIAETLNRCGFRTINGGKWRGSSVYKLIKRFEGYKKAGD